ncbi:MAG TPA: hypothetical protein VFX38_02500, partial [Gammaproteobacteria bacterium]|nr:hypothetical protein [Gammaproteobacteria bacterium]
MNDRFESLPLDLDAESFLALGHDMLELAAEWIAGEADDPLLQPIGGVALANLLDEPPPERGMTNDALFVELRERVLRYARRNGHPRYFAYVMASADPVGALADLLVSAMNQNVT